MRIGILGGTFDPPHKGHLHMALCAQDSLGLDQILFVPCSRQPLKREFPAASGFHRAAMVAMAISRRESWLLEPIELDQGGLSYTIETLSTLVQRFAGRDLYHLIIGQDSFASFPRWRRFEEILSIAKIVVIPRDPVIPEPLTPAIPADRVERISARPVKVSSTAIRERLSLGHSISGLVPRAVESYILKQGLYREGIHREPIGGDRDG